MKFTTTSLTALVLSAIEVQGTWWNSKSYGNGLISQPESKPAQYAWNSPQKFYQTTLNSFKRPGASPTDPQYNNILEQALANDQLRSSRPVPGPFDIKTSKVKVRVTIQYHCKHLPSIASVQDRVNKDYVMRRLIGKKFSAVHVNRFKCNTPMELYADFVFYVYEEDTATFPEILPSLKPSLCRAVGIHHTEQAKTIRILPEQEIIEEAVNQVSTSISKAIAQIGQADASDIVDVAVNNIIEQDSTSVNNIVDDLVSVINVDRAEVVNDLVSKVEDQIRIELANKNTELKEVDETVRLVTEAIADETQTMQILASETALASPASPEEMLESVTTVMVTGADDSQVAAGPGPSSEEGDITDFLSGFAAVDVDALGSIIEGIEIQGEESKAEPEGLAEDDLKAVLLEVTQAPMIDSDFVEQNDLKSHESQISAKELADEIVFNFSQGIEQGGEGPLINEGDVTLSESEIVEQAINEFKNTLMMGMNNLPETQPDQAGNSPSSSSIEQTTDITDETVVEESDIEDINENPIVSEILKFSEESNRTSESEESSNDDEPNDETVNFNEIAASIVAASEQAVQETSSEDSLLPSNDLVDMIAELNKLSSEIKDAQAEAEMDVYEDINDFSNDFSADDSDSSEDVEEFLEELKELDDIFALNENDIVSTILEIQSSTSESQNKNKINTQTTNEKNTNDEFSADDIYNVINSLVVEEAEGAGEQEFDTYDSVVNTVTVEGEEEEKEGETEIIENETASVKDNQSILEMNNNNNVSSNNNNNNSTVEIIHEDILKVIDDNKTSNHTLNGNNINNNDKIESIIKETEQTLINDNIVERVVNSLIVEVPEGLINQVASSRVNGTLSLINKNNENDSSEDESFINGMVETVMNLFSS